MDDAAAVGAVLVPPQLERFRRLCGVEGAITPQFGGFTKHVLLTDDRAFLFPRNHTIVDQLERECAIYATLDYPLVPKLLGRWADEGVSPYPFFAVTRLRGATPDPVTSVDVRALAAQLGAAIAACHEIPVDLVPRSLWANPWSQPPEVPPTAVDCFSPIREVGGAGHVAEVAASYVGVTPSASLTEALEAAEAMAPVLAHGDLHEGQLLVDPSGLTGVLDWGFGGVLSPLVDVTGVRELLGDQAPYGEVRRHLWAAYAQGRTAPLPTWEQVHLAMTAFDITAFAPETETHYYWQHGAAWQEQRRTAAGACLLAMLG